MIKRNEAGEPNPVIAEGASKLQQFSDTANDLAQRADETLRRINETLSTQNQAAITESLDNLRTATGQSRRSPDAPGPDAGFVWRRGRSAAFIGCACSPPTHIV